MNITHGGNLFEICRTRGWDWREVLDLSASINPLGPAPGVRAAIEAALDRIVHYPEKSAPVLAHRLAERWEVEPEQIILGNGVTELIHFLARVRPPEKVTLVVPTFSEYHRAYPRAHTSSFQDLPADGLVVLGQPNNPTGQALAFEVLRDWLLSSERPVLIDESFIEFCRIPSVAALTRRRKNLLVVRSMTKFHALPGLRVGALLADPETIAGLRAHREPWQVNVLAEAAALAALDDAEHAERTLNLITRERIWLWKRLWTIPGVKPVHSSANFFLVYLQGRAEDVCRWFLERKVILRDCSGWPGLSGEAIRFAIRTREENQRVIAMFREFLCRS